VILTEPTKVLLLARDHGLRRDAAGWLRTHGFGVAAHSSPAMAMEAIHAEELHLVAIVADDPEGADRFAHEVREERPDIPVVILSPGLLEDASAVAAALRAGEGRRRLLRLPPPPSMAFEGLVGGSRAMGDLRALLARILDVDAPLLLLGETGTGKEMVARLLHDHGPRRDEPFVAVNCAAIPEGLLESELFGHERGAFTNATKARFGLFATANGGTLMLDEIQSLPFHLQPKLLKVLEDRAIRPLGSHREVPFDVRILCASNVDLQEEVQVGRFRRDLLFRIDVLRVELPPLRGRDEDVLDLAQVFLESTARRRGGGPVKLSPAACEALLAHDWPGNVRELMHAMEAASTLASGDCVEVEDLPLDVRSGDGPSLPPTAGGLAELRRRHSRRVLEAVEGNKKRAAEVLGISRQRLYRLLRG